MKKKNIIKAAALILSITLGAKVVGSIGGTLKETLYWEAYQSTLDKNKEEFNEELYIYNENNKKYAEEIKSLNLSDLEIIMKVMNDTWNSINGYGKADELITGLYRLSFQEEGKGVCTSFADDFTAKMNCINPEYEARNIIVYMEDGDSTKKQVVDIERNILDYQNTTETAEDIKKSKKEGNHMVTAVELHDKKITLIVDPTNLLVGFLRNGKIHILNNETIKMKYIKNNTNIFSEDGPLDSNEELLETYFLAPTSKKTMNKNYGYEAQQTALNKVLSLNY